jgi:CAAX prenyl protease-like protein
MSSAPTKTKPTPDYESPQPRRTFVRDDLAYMLPMGTFLLFIAAAVHWPQWYAPLYAIKTLIVGVMLVLLWHHYTPIRWNYWWLGAICGAIGIVQWIALQLWLQHHFSFFRPSPDVFDPVKHFGDGTRLFWGFVGVRLLGAVAVVPVMEELFWRDWMWRTILAPNDFKLAKVGEWDWKAYLIVSGAFALVHGNWWLTAIVWGLSMGALLVWTRSLGACIVMHAVSNLLLGGYVLYTRDWSFW